MNQEDDPHAWRKEYMGMKVLSKMQLELLENGPKSLSQSWHLQALHSNWKKMKGYRDPEPPDCQSSMDEFFKNQDKYNQ